MNAPRPPLPPFTLDTARPGQIVQFLTAKWQLELDYVLHQRLVKHLAHSSATWGPCRQPARRARKD
jgi:nuclear transport factor 2 (NTF2) superfamily protein